MTTCLLVSCPKVLESAENESTNERVNEQIYVEPNAPFLVRARACVFVCRPSLRSIA